MISQKEIEDDYIKKPEDRNVCYDIRFGKISYRECIVFGDLLKVDVPDNITKPVFILKQWFNNKGEVIKKEKIFRWHKDKKEWIDIRKKNKTKTTKMKRIKK